MGLPNEIKDDSPVTLSAQPIKPGRSKNADHVLVGPLKKEEVYSSGKPPKNQEEFILWSEFKNGSEKALALIYNHYIFSLYNYGEMITSNKELIEDSIHDLFVDLWKNRDSISQAYSIRFYLYKGLKRKIIKNLSQERRLPFESFSEQHHLEMVFSQEFILIASEVSEEQKMSLLKAINKLSNRQKEAIVLRFYDNLSFREIGDLLSISVKSTYTLLYRAIEILKEKMEKNHILLLYFLFLFF